MYKLLTEQVAIDRLALHECKQGVYYKTFVK